MILVPRNIASLFDKSSKYDLMYAVYELFTKCTQNSSTEVFSFQTNKNALLFGFPSEKQIRFHLINLLL